MHVSMDRDTEEILLSGGLNTDDELTHTLLTYKNSWSSLTLPKKIAFHQSISFDSDLYAFGGITVDSNGLTYPNTVSIIGPPDGTIDDYTSNLPSSNTLSPDTVLYVKGNSIYRNTLALNEEELVYQHSENIFAPQVSPTGLEICFSFTNLQSITLQFSNKN